MTDLEYFTVLDEDPDPPPKTRMELAVIEVRNGATINSVAKMFKIPRSTLSDKVRGVSAINATMGPKSVLSREEEKLLVEWIKLCGKCNFPVTKYQILVSVGRLVIELKRSNPFTNGLPGKKWFAAFLRRNPEISRRTPQNLTISRAKITEEIVRKWFLEVVKYLIARGLMSILQDPSRLFNADEAAFFFNPKGESVFYEKGAKSVYSVINADEKECNTVLITISAAGDIPPPMVVFKYERVPKELAESVPKDWGIGRSESGWMTAPTFYEYITNIFNPWLIENNVQRPVILFVDGHSSHATYHLSKFCEENQIILIALPPNATHLLQPLDVGVFHPLKLIWVQILNEFRIANQQPIVKRKDFCRLLLKAISLCITKEIVRNSFRKCGIFPWDPNAVDYSKIPSASVSQAATPETNSVEVSPITSETMENEHQSKSQALLAKLDSYLGPDKVEFFCSVATASDWPELVDVEDHNLFTIWRQMYVEAHNSQPVDVPLADRVLPQDISEMVTVQLTVNDCVSDKVENAPQLDDLIDFQGIIPSSPSKTVTLSSVSKDDSSDILISTSEAVQNQPRIENISQVPSTSTLRSATPNPSQNLPSHRSATTSTPKPSPVISSPVRLVVEKSASENISSREETVEAKQTSTQTPDSSSCGVLALVTPPSSAPENSSSQINATVSQQASVLTPESSSCRVLSLVTPSSSAPKNSSSHINATVLKEASILTSESSSCRVLSLVTPQSSAPKNSSSQINATVSKQASILTPESSSCRVLSLVTPPSSAPKNSSSQINATVLKEASILTPELSSCRALSLVTPPSSAPKNSFSHIGTSVSKQASISTPESSSCRVLSLVTPSNHEISTTKPPFTPQNRRPPLAELSCNTIVTPVQANTTPVSRNKNSKIPSPFKRALLYPEPIKRHASKNKREIYPSVVSSEDWQRYHERKIQQKENLEKEKQARKAQREENRKKKLEDQAAKPKRAKKMKKTIRTPECSDSEAEDDPPPFKEEDYVIVEYEEEFFPGQILKMEQDKAFVKTMKMAGIEVWKWPLKDDKCYYNFCDIKCLIEPPTAPSKRGHFKIPEMKNFR